MSDVRDATPYDALLLLSLLGNKHGAEFEVVLFGDL